MTKEELIAHQQLQIEELKAKRKANKEVYKKIHSKFYGMGQPLNDNNLKFNEAQTLWAMSVYSLISDLEL